MATVFIECSLKLILVVNQWSNEIIIVLFAVVVQFSHFHLLHGGQIEIRILNDRMQDVDGRRRASELLSRIWRQ